MLSELEFRHSRFTADSPILKLRNATEQLGTLSVGIEDSSEAMDQCETSGTWCSSARRKCEIVH